MSIFDMQYQAQLRAQYPRYGDGSWHIVMMGSSIDKLGEMPHNIRDRARELENDDGFFPDDAIEKAIEESVIACEAPDGCLFARLEKDGEKPVLLTLRLG